MLYYRVKCQFDYLDVRFTKSHPNEAYYTLVGKELLTVREYEEFLAKKPVIKYCGVPVNRDDVFETVNVNRATTYWFFWCKVCD